MSTYCQLARTALHEWLESGETKAGETRFGQRAACFVSLHEQDGSLRGCIGTLSPGYPDLAQEIQANAVAAGTRDPRFPAVTLDELPGLKFDVSVLKRPEPIADESGLDPSRYGVIVVSKGRRGVLLPGLDGIDTVDQQLNIARRKAGIARGEPVQLSRFEVEWHHDD